MGSCARHRRAGNKTRRRFGIFLPSRNSSARTAMKFGSRAILGATAAALVVWLRSEEHTSELQSRPHLVCRLLLEKKNYDCNRVSEHYARMQLLHHIPLSHVY